MNRETVVVCPELDAGSGGLADYTLLVAKHWPSTASLRFVVPESETRGGRSLPASLNVTRIQPRGEFLLAALPERDGAVLLQYSAYGFDHFGYPRWLLRALIDWKLRTRGLLVIMFHEIWTFWPLLNKNFFVQLLHRRDIGKLVQTADAIFTSTTSQAEHLQRLGTKHEIKVLPVGSNVQPVRTPGDRDPGLAVLFGLGQTRSRTLEIMQSDLRSLARAGVITKLISIGAGSGVEEAERERSLLEALQLREGFEQRGQTREAELSELLLAAQFGISGQDDLSLTKSGTFMAYAAHRANVISPSAGTGKGEPSCWLVAPNELLRGISSDDLRERAERLRDWQERTASWPHIAAEFARALQVTEVSQSDQ